MTKKSADYGRNPIRAFAAIQRGMSIEDIERLVGQPARRIDQGTQLLDYALSDGSRLQILYATPQLIKLVHFRKDGSKMSWVPHIKGFTTQAIGRRSGQGPSHELLSAKRA